MIGLYIWLIVYFAVEVVVEKETAFTLPTIPFGSPRPAPHSNDKQYPEAQ